MAPLNIFKQSPKATVVIGASENRLPLIAPAEDVVKSPWKMHARAASHARPLAPCTGNISRVEDWRGIPKVKPICYRPFRLTVPH